MEKIIIFSCAVAVASALNINGGEKASGTVGPKGIQTVHNKSKADTTKAKLKAVGNHEFKRAEKSAKDDVKA